jgi:hypothetical protein
MYSATGRIQAVVLLFALSFSGGGAQAQLAKFVRTEADPVRLASIRMMPASCSGPSGNEVSVARATTPVSDDIGSTCDTPPVIAPPVDPCSSSNFSNKGCIPLRDVAQENLATLGKPGQKILRARDKVLEIFERENACTAWFREKDSNPAATFRTIRFILDGKGQEYVLDIPDDHSKEMLHFPYVAKVVPGEGAYSSVIINKNGAFFYPMAAVVKGHREVGGLSYLSQRTLKVGPYWGDTLAAQVLALLHEFGHVVERLQDDGEDQGEKSAQNTNEVLRYCRAEVESTVKHGLFAANR